MGSSNKKFFVQSILCCLAIIAPYPVRGVPEYTAHKCRNTRTYTSNRIFLGNRKVLFSTIASNATRNHGYYNYTAGRSSGNLTYGLSLCQGDITLKECQECVTMATKDIETRCPIEDLGVIWFGVCMVWYDSDPFFITKYFELGPVYLLNPQNVTDQAKFEKVLGSTLNDLTARVSEGKPLNNQIIKRFAVGTANVTSLQTVYASAQCIPDLSDEDCAQCLKRAMYLLQDHNNSQGSRVLFSSCNIRYEMYPFYRKIATPPPPPPPPAVTPSSVSRRKGNGGNLVKVVVAIVATIGVALVIFLIGYCYLIREKKVMVSISQEEIGNNEISTIQNLQFELSTIEAATSNFSPDNKIRAGGFGDVFKGVLANGQQIAVKRLSKTSGQGSREFQNEVVLVAKLQHRNLVRLLGFCLGAHEKILIYEYIPNKSLDNILFDSERIWQLNWSKRYKIIGGIARGMVYLHEDSRLRIIHRDLKASNILLDEDMNAKISDFGMARILGGEQTHGDTSRIVGTFGYMSPEYAMHGQFSLKSDVLCFGVLVLEIVSGKKINSFNQRDNDMDLLSYAWKQWKNSRPLELMDPSLTGSYMRNEVLRCIQIGLLCVQEDMDARPSMASVLTMLTSHSVSIGLPQQPPFFFPTNSVSQPLDGVVGEDSASKSLSLSVDDTSITGVYAR